MAGLKRALDTEIQRVSGAEVRKATRKIRETCARLRKEVKVLQQQVAALRREVQAGREQPVVPEAAVTSSAPAAEIRGSRPTAESVKSMRQKLDVSQRDLARLLGVTPLTVYLWERQKGRLNLRSKAKIALYNARKMTKRQAAERLAQLPPE